MDIIDINEITRVINDLAEEGTTREEALELMRVTYGIDVDAYNKSAAAFKPTILDAAHAVYAAIDTEEHQAFRAGLRG